MQNIKRNLTYRLKKYRKLNGYTQEQAAERLGISTPYYGEIERGTKTPATPTLLILCESIGCTLDELTYDVADTVDEEIDNGIREEINEIVTTLLANPQISHTTLLLVKELANGFTQRTDKYTAKKNP